MTVAIRSGAPSLAEERHGLEGWFQRPWAASESVRLWCKMVLVTWLGVNTALLGGT